MLLKNYASNLLSVSLVLGDIVPPNSRQRSVKMELQILHGDSIKKSSLQKRSSIIKRSDDSSLVELDGELTYFQATVRIGSKREKNTLMIDTSSSDLWVMSKDVSCEGVSWIDEDEHKTNSKTDSANFKTHSANETTVLNPDPSSSLNSTFQPNACKVSGSFSTADSSSFQKNHYVLKFEARSVRDIYASGIWGIDTVDYANAAMNMSFAVVNKTSDTIGVLGLGLIFGESTFTRPYKKYIYTNYPMQLKVSGFIHKALYSMVLSKSKRSGGFLLFGAIDHNQYTGPLQTVPIVNLNKNFRRLDLPSIKLGKMYLESEYQNVVVLNQPIGAVLDSGTIFQKFPRNVLKALANSMSAKYLPKRDLYRVACAYKTNSGSLVYDFSGIKIKVPVGEMVIKRGGMCYLGATSFDDESRFPTAILGISFLRNAYVVYDLEDMEISMAPSRFTEKKDEEDVLRKIPKAVRAPSYAYTALASEINNYTTLKFKPSNPKPKSIKDVFLRPI